MHLKRPLSKNYTVFFSDHFTFCLKCKRKCKDRLSQPSNLNDRTDEAHVFTNMYFYLMYAYYKGKISLPVANLFHSSQQIPRKGLGPLKGCWSWYGRLLGLALLSELQSYTRTPSRCVGVPGHRQEQLPQTLIVHLLKHTCFCWSKNLGNPGPLCSCPPAATPTLYTS